jgi:hypothetical protein
MSALEILLAAGVTALAAPDLPPDGLGGYRWKARPILIFAAEDDPRLAEQARLLAREPDDLRERRNVVVIDTHRDGALAARFDPGAFTVTLVGLDGGEKFRSEAVTDPDALDDLIDRMPMRRRELREGG